MKVDLNQVLLNADDTPAVIGATKEPATLKWLLIQTMLADHNGVGPTGQPLPITHQDKIKRYELYRQLKKTKVPFILLAAEDIAFLKEALLMHPVLTAGQARDMLEVPYVEPPAPAPGRVVLIEGDPSHYTYDEHGVAAP